MWKNGKNLLNLIRSSFFVFFSSLDSLTRENPWLVFFFSLSRFIKGKSRAVLVVMQKHKLNMNNSCQLSKTIMSTVQLSIGKFCVLRAGKNIEIEIKRPLMNSSIIAFAATDWTSFFLYVQDLLMLFLESCQVSGIHLE